MKKSLKIIKVQRRAVKQHKRQSRTASGPQQSPRKAETASFSVATKEEDKLGSSKLSHIHRMGPVR